MGATDAGSATRLESGKPLLGMAVFQMTNDGSQGLRLLFQ